MAELLLRALDSPNGAWKLGDVVWAQEDGAEWGRLETLEGGFLQVKLTGLSVAEAEAYKAPLLDTQGKDVAPRRHRFAVETAERREPPRDVFTTGRLERVWSEVSSLVEDKAAQG